MKELTTPPTGLPGAPATPPPTTAAAPVAAGPAVATAPPVEPSPAIAGAPSSVASSTMATTAVSFQQPSRGPGAPTAAAATAPVASTGQRIADDAAAWTPSYNVPGEAQPVRARTAFRMIKGDNQISSEEAQNRIRSKLGNKLPADLNARLPAITSGRGTPEEVRRLTQLLIDNGALDDPGNADPNARGEAPSTETRIRRLQWQYGLGCDCQGSLRPIIADLRGGSAGKSGDDLILTDTAGNPTSGSQDRFTTVAKADGNGILNAQPGDVIKLNAPGVGHYVMVREAHTVQAGSPEAEAMGATGPRVTGPLRVMTVFSSWGANGSPDDPRGGVREEQWVCDTGRKPPRWGVIGGDGQVAWDQGVFAGHTLQGVYRPKR